MKYQVLLEVDSGLDILATDEDGNFALGNDLILDLSLYTPWWPNHTCPEGGTQMPGTRVYNARKLVHAFISTDSEDPLAELEAVIAAYGLNWIVRAMYSLDTYPLVDANGDPVVDADGNQETGPLIELEVAPEVADFLADEWVGDPPVAQRPTLPKSLHQFAGKVHMAVAA